MKLILDFQKKSSQLFTRKWSSNKKLKTKTFRLASCSIEHVAFWNPLTEVPVLNMLLSHSGGIDVIPSFHLIIPFSSTCAFLEYHSHQYHVFVFDSGVVQISFNESTYPAILSELQGAWFKRQLDLSSPKFL